MLLIGIVMLYAVVSAPRPAHGDFVGAFSATASARFPQQMTSRDALEALKLTLILSVGATVGQHRDGRGAWRGCSSATTSPGGNSSSTVS